MNKVLIIAWREFVETVRTRAFFFGVIFTPALILAMVFGAERIARVASSQAQPLRRIAVLDSAGIVYEALRPLVDARNAQRPGQPLELLRVPFAPDSNATRPGPSATAPDDDSPAPHETLPDALRDQVLSGEIYAVLRISPGPGSVAESATLLRRDSQLELGEVLSRLTQEAIIEARFQTADPPIDRERILGLVQPPRVISQNVSSGQTLTNEERMGRLLAPFAIMFILYMGTFGISMHLLTSVLEEKSSRVIEVLLSAASPLQLMSGKILGMVMVGFVMLGVYILAGLGIAQTRDISYAIDAPRLAWVVIYFVPGFLLSASLLAALGAACNTLKEAQSLSSPLTLLNIVPMILWFQLSQYPHSALSTALSFIPPITPFVMILRLCADPDLPRWEIAATLAVLWAAVFASIWAAAKVFRVGILMYGKPPSLREMARWLRYN